MMHRTALSYERPPADSHGAFCQENHVASAATADGSLSGLTFAVKDVFDVAGSRTGFGHPAWLRTHSPAAMTADAVTRLLQGGADLVGRTISDELCYSISGENPHYGMPINPKAPDRLPGGSSSGSAVAVAGGSVDFAIGTDCGGSVRVPGSYCGLFGIRPTHGRISLAGVSRFAPSFDTVGWFARDAATLNEVGKVLLGVALRSGFKRMIVALDAFERADSLVHDVLETGLSRLRASVPEQTETRLSTEGLDVWVENFRLVQASEIWASLGQWIEQTHPVLGQGVGQRIEIAAHVTKTEAEAARQRATVIAADLASRIGEHDLVCLPTTPGIAPTRTTAAAEIENAYRRRAMELLCPAGLGGLPQLTVPVGTVNGAPVGLSIMARRGKDLDLLEFAMNAFSDIAIPPEAR